MIISAIYLCPGKQKKIQKMNFLNDQNLPELIKTELVSYILSGTTNFFNLKRPTKKIFGLKNHVSFFSVFEKPVTKMLLRLHGLYCSVM